MNLEDIKGLKYPDDYFIKFFFKKNFHKKQNMKFIEFGSSNGSNLMLPYQYGHNIIGIDIDKQAIDNANINFKNNINKNTSFKFYLSDMRQYAEKTQDIEADVFLLPNVINYITKKDFIAFLQLMIKNNNLKKDSSIFIRCRTPKDFRFGMGKKIEYNTYQLDKDYTITGEAGCLNTFYDEYEIVSILQSYLNLNNFVSLNCDFQNLQEDNTVVSNSDIILWGTID